MTIDKISFQVAWQLCSCRADLEYFFTHATPGEIFPFTHYNFFYSYPSFGRVWPNGLLAQFHRVHTCCSKCQAFPDRNFAGIGSINLSMRPDRKASLLCDECAKGEKVFGEVESYVQGKLFCPY
ncbi:MAG: hypothetical protein ACTHJN_20290 [Ginsengibacter sp.]